jgi:hypothetical protein
MTPTNTKQFKRFFWTLCVVLIFSLSVFAQRKMSALLPASEAKAVTKQCSRPSPEVFSGTGEPSQKEILEMEANFAKIKKLKVKKCCIRGAQIEAPEEFYMQYVGIVVDGKKLIYVNAFGEFGTLGILENGDSNKSIVTLVQTDHWKMNAVRVCDGGHEWGVLYNPKTQKFFDLAINGTV